MTGRGYQLLGTIRISERESKKLLTLSKIGFYAWLVSVSVLSVCLFSALRDISDFFMIPRGERRSFILAIGSIVIPAMIFGVRGITMAPLFPVASAISCRMVEELNLDYRMQWSICRRFMIEPWSLSLTRNTLTPRARVAKIGSMLDRNNSDGYHLMVINPEFTKITVKRMPPSFSREDHENYLQEVIRSQSKGREAPEGE